MPIEVEGPDGVVIEFPDGTDQVAIIAAMRARYGGPGATSHAPADFSGVRGGARSTEDGTARDGWKRGAGRDFMMGARSTIQGAGGLIGALGGDAFNYYIANPLERATGTKESSSWRDAGTYLSDKLGLPKPETARERVIGEVGEALTGTGLTMGVGGLLNTGRQAVSAAAPSIRQSIGALLTTQPALQTVSTATGAGASAAVREGGGSQGQQIAAGLLGSIAPGAAVAVPAATARGLVRGSSGADMQRTIDDFARLGASPSVGQASGNRAIQGVENLLAGGPTSSGVMARFAEGQADDIGAGLRTMADRMHRNASGERAGSAVLAGVKSFGGDVSAKRNALYQAADTLIPGGTGTPMSNTVRVLTDLTTPDPGAAATTGRMVNPRMQAMLSDLQSDLAANNGVIPYESLRRVRTNIGEQMSDFSMQQDTPAKQLKALYSALSSDMEAAAIGVGPDAVRAAKRANDYTKYSANRLESLQRVIDKNGGPESVYNAVMQGSRDGGTTLRKVMQSLDADGQRAVTAATIKRMGMPTPGQAGVNAAEEFSSATFLTNWNRISPEARKALFDRHGLGFSNDMDRLARVADNIKSGSKVYANPSGTANKAAGYTYGASLVASLFDPSFVSLGGLVGGGVAANISARLLTNPKVVRRLAATTTMPKGAIPAAINSIAAQGEKDGDEDLLELARQLQQAEQNASNAGNQ